MVEVTHWQDANRPTEAMIRRLLSNEGLQAYAWSNGPHDVYSVHDHSYHKVIYVVEGSITFILPALDQQLLLQVGDRMELPRGVQHGAEVGPQGVICLEAHR
jgi:quercetin dioxygenase-like cupin family protein